MPTETALALLDLVIQLAKASDLAHSEQLKAIVLEREKLRKELVSEAINKVSNENDSTNPA